VPFNVFVTGDNFTDTNGIGGVEWGLSGLPVGTWFILSFTLESGGVNLSSTNTNVIAGYPSPLDNTGSALLGTYQILPTTTEEVLLKLGPSSPSSFGGAGPGWAQGANPEILHQFAFASDLLLNQSTMDTPPGSPVPVPAAVWLFGSGLLGLIGIARRKKVA